MRLDRLFVSLQIHSQLAFTAVSWSIEDTLLSRESPALNSCWILLVLLIPSRLSLSLSLRHHQ